MLALGVILITSLNLHAQDWNTFGNNITGLGQYLGADAASNQPLRFTTFANYAHEWRTNNVQRMRLNGNPAGVNINGYAGTLRDGFLLLSGQPDAFTNAACDAPFTRLHLVDPIGSVNPINYAQEFGFRPWQKNGVTFTGNSDQGYIGQKYNSNDATDMVIQWSDNPSTDPWASDKLRFIFSANPTPLAPTGMRSLEGLEAMRFWPKNPNEVNVGVGDFFAAGVGEPSERLDLVNGKVRIRQLPIDAVSTSPEAVVVNMTPGPNYGVLEHRPLDNCEWNLYQGIAPFDMVYTAFGPPAAGCPDDEDRVGIGVLFPGSKLHTRATTAGNPVAGSFESVGSSGSLLGVGVVAGTAGSIGAQRQGLVTTALNGSTSTLGLTAEAVCSGTNTTQNRAIEARAEMGGDTSATYNRGIYSRALGNSQFAYGVETYAENGSSQTFGAYNYAKGSSVPGNIVYGSNNLGNGGTCNNSNEVYGVSGVARDGRTSIGVYGRATACPGGVALAGKFDGDVLINGVGTITSGVWLPSDANLKANIQALPSTASAQLAQLDAMTYQFVPSAAPQAELPAGDQAGFMAQQMEQLFPELVRESQFTAMLDSMGNVVHPAVQYKAVNTIGLIPYMISAMQEQNARIDQLQAQLAQCCSTGATDSRSMQQGTGSSSTGMETDLRIIPNPVAANTLLRYTVGTPGRVRLEVSDGMGRVIEVLEESTRSTGEFTYDWNTQQLSAGTYYCTLFVNDEPLVKKAVKLNER
jgi:hypothetical protein